MKVKFAFGLLPVFFIWITACSQPPPFPTELIGTWITKDLTYEDRYLEINEVQLIFGTGGGEPNIFFIDKIKKSVHKDLVEWTFYCQSAEGAAIDMALFFQKGEGGGIVELKNNKQIKWIKLLD